MCVVNVGTGGHSMSDLWGVRDYVLKHYPQYRYCSYDMPGTGWSDPRVSDQPEITERIMTAIGETGPFIMIGTSFVCCPDAAKRVYRSLSSDWKWLVGRIIDMM